jgi:hypothetical protein
MKNMKLTEKCKGGKNPDKDKNRRMEIEILQPFTFGMIP